ncbi:putative ADP-ribosylglycohydrolase [Powai lake megavirus]|uniref:Putative ADP-ribosylglycohydrolase n=1 Tax=Powai lake megavirus TaxID=1842663 RepID=A0A167RDG0_9VIRU|nr:putative ADP-ribosylglycohydrolase [Powai lake megavirus]ANB50559.1 putative ADP-ribosylglycohydrolase [Powai lake megavirus]
MSNKKIQNKNDRSDKPFGNINMAKLVDKYQSESRKYIYNILVDEYKINKKLAKEIEENVNKSTISRMTERYKFNEPYTFWHSAEELGMIDEYRIAVSNYTDFVDFMSTSLIIPFYQSFGDTLGYYNGNWEFNYGDAYAGPDYVNDLIYDFIDLGGINDISILNWLSSDDTILYMTTMSVLTECMAISPYIDDINIYGEKLRDAYLKARPMIENRHPGQTTIDSLDILSNIAWNEIPYNSRAIGAGSVMRSGCIGIFFVGSHNRQKLIALAVECSRLTHNSTSAILGSIVAALFTAYALEKVPINYWPHKLLKLLRSDMIDEYMKKSRPKEYNLFVRDKVIYIGQWKNYVDLRFSGINPRTNLRYMKNPVERYRYLSDNFSKGCDIPGSCADDSVIMAYDALLQSGGIMEKIIVYSILHPGDSDTVGSIAMSWFGAMYHSPKNHFLIDKNIEQLEFRNNLYQLYEDNVLNMLRVYYRDIYINTARKIIKQTIKPK